MSILLKMKKIAFIFIVLIGIIQYKIWFASGSASTIDALMRDVAEQKKENEALKVQNLELRKEIDALRRNPDLLEAVAREQLGLIKPNEKFYRIIPKERD